MILTLLLDFNPIFGIFSKEYSLSLCRGLILIVLALLHPFSCKIFSLDFHFNVILHSGLLHDHMILAAGDPGIVPGSCPNRKESQPLNSRYASLFLQNYFPTIPFENEACKEHSVGLAEMVDACYKAAGNIMPNFIAVNFYMV